MNIKTQLRWWLMRFTMSIRLIFESGLSQSLESISSNKQGGWKYGVQMATDESRYVVPASVGVKLD